MRVDVLSLARMPGGSMPLDFVIDADELLVHEDENCRFESIRFEGIMLNIENEVFQLTGILRVVRTGICDRCLRSARQEYEISIDEQYRRSTGSTEMDESGEFYGYAGHSIDIDQAIRDNLLLNTPVQLLCRDACPGFCPVCGRDLNEESCNCQAEPDAESPFAKLSKLLQDDEDVLRT
ncbi:MAG: DUF177 domain-containing protein [Clostridiaceae bacterium]|nr:DUF177 domain-containing protein [Clostridiaceae bacterium]